VQAEKLASLGTLVAGVAHEVNNPNFAVMSNADTLAGIWEPLRDSLDRHTAKHGDFPVGHLRYSEVRELVPELITGVIDASERIKHIVNELRDYARHEPPDRHEPVDVNGAVESAIRLVGSLIKRCTTRFSVELATNLPPVNGNSRRLEQVVVNLLQNACQALPGPDRAIFVSTRFDASRRLVVIAVHDEGEGIQEQDLAHLTDPFFTTKRDSGGTGLGLSISAAIVEEHQGSLSFESTPGQGTVIRVHLPAAPGA
jgi:polar amino acid transport system substrate-binding protein